MNYLCKKCHDKHSMPWDFCCLHGCGEHEFCRDCQHGIYDSNFESLDNGETPCYHRYGS